MIILMSKQFNVIEFLKCKQFVFLNTTKLILTDVGKIGLEILKCSYLDPLLQIGFNFSGYKHLLCVGTTYDLINVWLLPKHLENHHSLDPELLLTLGGHFYSPVTSLAIDSEGILLASGIIDFIKFRIKC